ncbi:MAG: aminotransferase class I/II-fold pyridoxal phosphate-dependent enzyme, partial [Pseudomonadota bacterium]
MSKRDHLDTDAIHAGELRPRVAGAVSLPVFQSSTFESVKGAGYHDLGYIRLNNTPNHDVLHAKVAALEGAEAGLVAASGMAVITTTLLSLLKAGDHLLAQNVLYGGTQDFLDEDLPELGIEVTYFDADQPELLPSLVRPNTRVIYAETISNPLLRIGDLEALALFARERGIVSMIDSTFASPFNCRPIDLGFDLVMHSATKYLNGHSDIVAGALAGSEALVSRVKKKLDHLGGCLDPHACFLLHRGLKTLPLRMRQHNANALTLAQALKEHPAVARVHYPGLPDHPDHKRAARLLAGFGGMVSFELHATGDAIDAALAELKVFAFAPSLGGVETLVSRPATTSHAGMPESERHARGIVDGLVRVSVGCELAEDLIADLLPLLDRFSAPRQAA